MRQYRRTLHIPVSWVVRVGEIRIHIPPVLDVACPPPGRLRPPEARIETMLNKDIKHIIGSAMLFDERHRFDAWKGDEAKEWVEQIADAIIGLLTSAPVGSCPAGGEHDWPTKTGEIYTGVCQKCGQGR